MHTTERLAAGRIYSPRRIAWLARTFAALLILWRERARSRRALLELDDAILRDIGRTRREAAHEARKPFWRA